MSLICVMHIKLYLFNTLECIAICYKEKMPDSFWTKGGNSGHLCRAATKQNNRRKVKTSYHHFFWLQGYSNIVISDTDHFYCTDPVRNLLKF